MKIGIITWHFFDNVGSNLQAYALHNVIKKMGHDVKNINYRAEQHDERIIKRTIKRFFVLIDKLLPGILPEKYRFGSLAFTEQYLKCTKLFHTKEELEHGLEKFDAVICGSDQIWAPNCFDDVYMLSFVDDETKKIAYAPSIGLNDIPEEFIEAYKKWIGRIDYLSVREDKGVELLERCCGLKATQVLDPTLLLETRDWELLFNNETAPSGEYIFSYLLGEKQWIRESIRKFADEKGMRLIIYSQISSDQNYADEYFERMGSPKFLKCISQAAYVLTDSFHGLLFSVQFHKEVYVYDRYDEDEEKCQNSRIKSILEVLGISDRRVSRNTVLSNAEEIDYKMVDCRLRQERRKSLEFLETALKS